MSKFKKSKLGNISDLLRNEEKKSIKESEKINNIQKDICSPDKKNDDVIKDTSDAKKDTSKRPHVVEFKNVTKKYVSDDGSEVVAVKDINFYIQDLPVVSEMVVILGASGCGKSTILKIIAGLIKPDEHEGDFLYFGNKVEGPAVDRAMVFQDYSSMPWLNVINNVALGLKLNGVKKKERLAVAKKYIEWVGLKGKEKMYPPDLSGGQRQRVAIARTLAVNSRVILMDEPFGALDISTRYEMQELLCKIYTEIENTIILVTHDISEAVYLADTILLMTPSPGQIVEKIDIPLARDEFGRRNRESREYGDMENLLRNKMISIVEGTYGKKA